MKIGIDIDNVISNFDDVLLKEYLKHDKELRNSGIINENAKYVRDGMFDWTEKEEKEFYMNNIERIARKLQTIYQAPEIIKTLKEDGHEIFIITGRENGEYTNAYELTKKWLKQNNVIYDHLILTNAYQKEEKAKVCVENHIDIMIEDSTKTCKYLQECGIRVLLMNTRYNQEVKGFERVTKWKEIYEKIKQLEEKPQEEKKKVILDTDTYNECDDQFALSYLLKSQDKVEVEAITVAPFHHDNSISIEEGTEKSYQEVIKICNWLKFDTTNKVFKGTTGYFKDNCYNNNPAVEKIINIALKNEKTYLLAIGAITNVAVAIKKEPQIIGKIEVIWLGGHSLLYPNNQEFNFRQDIQAVKEVFQSKVKLTIIPCKNVASNLRTSIYELEQYLKGKNELCNYLCDRFYNDGIHGIQERRVIWDISAIAYILYPEWFETQKISCPMIREDSSYQLTEGQHEITMVSYLNVDKIFQDLFQKLGEK